MTDVLTPMRADTAISRINPVAKLAASLLLAAVLVLTIDWVSAAVALACEFVLFFFAGVSFKAFMFRTIPIWIAPAGPRPATTCCTVLPMGAST